LILILNLLLNPIWCPTFGARPLRGYGGKAEFLTPKIALLNGDEMKRLPSINIAGRTMALPAAIAATLLTFSLVVFPAISRAAEDASPGRQLFEKRCTGCHSLDRHKEGPNLSGVYGRQAGTAPGFNYSPALKSAHFVWDDQRLEKWLTDTQSLVEDNNMDFHVPKADERAAIILYLKSISAPQRAASSPAHP
jgi:cytochrome c